MRWVVPVVAVLALALAGCGGKDSGANKVALGDGSRLSLDLPPEQQPAPDDIRGAISGVVVDDAIFPLPGASVHIRDRSYNTTADANGRFNFTEVPPGLYTVEVSKDDYADGLGTVNVKSGQVAKAVVMSARLPYVAPYHTVWAFDELRSGNDYLFGQAGNHEHVIPFDYRPQTVVLESVWDGLTASPAGDALQYSIAGEKVPESKESGGGPNPLLKVYAKDFFDKKEYATRISVVPDPLSTPVEVKGRVFATLFYVDPAPADWSFVGGDQ